MIDPTADRETDQRGHHDLPAEHADLPEIAREGGQAPGFPPPFGALADSVREFVLVQGRFAGHSPICLGLPCNASTMYRIACMRSVADAVR